MTAHGEQSYHSAFDKDGSLICPECGYDFTGQESESVEAHRKNHWDDIPAGEAYDEARRRNDILRKIAKELAK